MRNSRNPLQTNPRIQIAPAYPIRAATKKPALGRFFWQALLATTAASALDLAKKLDSEDSFLDRSDGFARLEAILFLSREPLNTRKLSQLAGLADGTEARMLVKRLNAHYDDVGRAFRIEEVAGGFQLFSRRKFGPWLQRLAHIPGETRLSAPGLETLAVIAYRQPVLRADIEAIRGVNCGEIIRQLMERDLVRIGGRSEELGRPYLYSTTRRFLNLFGLANLDELPRGDELREISLEGFQGEILIPVEGVLPEEPAEFGENSSESQASLDDQQEAASAEGDEERFGAFLEDPNSLESTLADPSGQ